MPKISFIIPAYNVERFIKRCLDSIYSIGVESQEVIVVDDGSTDATSEIIESYRHTHPDMLIISQPNRGLSAARNSGLEKATGEFVWFVDSDDYLEPAASRNLIDSIDSYYDAYVFGRNEVRENKKVSLPVIPAEVFESGKAYLRASIDGGWFRTNAWDKIFKMSVIKENSLTFKEGLLYEDMLFCIQFFTFATCIRSLPTYPYDYYLGNNGSITHSVREKDLDVLTFIKLAEEFAQKNPVVWSELTPELNQLVFNWTSSCLLNKYVPLSFKNDVALKMVKSVLDNPYFKRSVEYCAKNKCRFRYKFFAKLISFSPLLYRILLSLALKIKK